MDWYHEAVQQWLRNDRKPPEPPEEDPLLRELRQEAETTKMPGSDRPPAESPEGPEEKATEPARSTESSPFLFLVVMTVQEGDPPAVKATDDGLVTVGGQTIRFDGQKIVLTRHLRDPE